MTSEDFSDFIGKLGYVWKTPKELDIPGVLWVSNGRRVRLFLVMEWDLPFRPQARILKWILETE